MTHKGSDKPWMLCVNVYDPHPPFDAPEEYEEKYLKRNLSEPIFTEKDKFEEEKLSDVYFQSSFKVPDAKEKREKASYYGMIEVVDKHFGMIINSLEELGLRDDTVIIYTSDHGESLGDHGHTHKGRRFYEGLVHVPLIISWPEKFKQNVRCEDITELTDIVPTISEITGIKYDDTTGFSLVPVFAICRITVAAK